MQGKANNVGSIRRDLLDGEVLQAMSEILSNRNMGEFLDTI